LRLIFKYIIAILFVASVTLFTTIDHEKYHAKAYAYKGYHNTSYSFNLVRASATNHDLRTPRDESDLYIANMTNDAVAYNTQYYFIAILLVLSFIFITLTETHRTWQEKK